MKCRADFGDGGEGGFVGAGEAAEGEVNGLLLRLLWLAVFDQTRGDETSGDGRIWRAVCVVFAIDGEVQRVSVVGFAVDYYKFRCFHIKRMVKCIGLSNLQ